MQLLDRLKLRHVLKKSRKIIRKEKFTYFFVIFQLVTIFIGSVDFCDDVCFWKTPRNAPQHFKKHLESALDFLMENSPRTIVNFIITARKQCTYRLSVFWISEILSALAY